MGKLTIFPPFLSMILEVYSNTYITVSYFTRNRFPNRNVCSPYVSRTTILSGWHCLQRSLIVAHAMGIRCVQFKLLAPNVEFGSNFNAFEIELGRLDNSLAILHI